MSITIDQIRRYPVKGLSPEALEIVDLTPGQALPFDRRFALTLGTTHIDESTIAWMDKTNFLSLLRHEKLAKLKTKFDGDTGVLKILRGGKPVAKGNITTPVGRAMVEEFFAAFMGESAFGRPKLVEAQTNATLSDHANAVVSIINLASVKDLERVTGAAVNPLRFRGNVYLGGLEPWAEFNWVGNEITLGGATLEITERIDRCAATNVDPETAVRDLSIPKDLHRGFNHIDMGVYGKVTTAGTITAGDTCIPPR